MSTLKRIPVFVLASARADYGIVMSYVFLFFFSSRRRHTRSKRDWSSDVCSSDLCCPGALIIDARQSAAADHQGRGRSATNRRSEERRVGKECRSRWWPDQ